MRVTTAFNKMLAVRAASIAGVSFTSEGIVVSLRRRRQKHRCPCGKMTWASYDRSVRRWRHLDLGATRCYLEAEIVRVDCRACGRVRTEEVPWARPGSRHTRDFQDVVCYLAHRGYGHRSLPALIAMIYLCCGGITVSLPFEEP